MPPTLANAVTGVLHSVLENDRAGGPRTSALRPTTLLIQSAGPRARKTDKLTG